ncbi:heme chaperone HemW [Gammaproteobacteria bacterium]
MATLLPEKEYLEALSEDLTQELLQVPRRRVVSVFFGGGTPSLFSHDGIGSWLSKWKAPLSLSTKIEITLEANPGTVSAHRLRGFRAAGINRLSLGVQSFDDGCLERLGRIHSRKESLKAFSEARAAGFENINLDIMYGLPGQDLTMARQDLETAVLLAPEHLSYYSLTIEPGTVFYQTTPTLPSEETLWDMQMQGEAMLRAAGYLHYEVSGYAKPKRRCLHNLNYWKFGDYIGIGAGAHGKITTPKGIFRRWKTSRPEDYLAKTRSQCYEELEIPTEDMPVEFMLNALRLLEGVPTALYQKRTRLPLDTISAAIASARAKGLLDPREDRLVATPFGQRFLNELVQEFLKTS